MNIRKSASASESGDTHAAAPDMQERLTGDPPLTSLLNDLVTSAGDITSGRLVDRLRRFQQAASDRDAIREWFCGELPSPEALKTSLAEAIVQLDEWISDQVNEVLHHPRFQKLEASWRGLHYLWRTRNELVEQSDWRQPPKLEISVINISLQELQVDFRRAVEFDQSLLFRRIYTQGFDQAGATPMSMLIADYEFGPWPGPAFPYDGVGLLNSLAGIGASSFCPVITAASPQFFELDSFEGLDRIDLDAVFDPQRNQQYIKWKSLRASEDSRFLGLTLPRVLMRRPWRADPAGARQFRFEEKVRRGDRSGYLWGNSAFAFGEVVMRAFAQTGWLANIRGVTRDSDANGLVRGLPSDCDRTERDGLVPRPSVEVLIPDSLERTISSFGFIPLCHCQDTKLAAFYSNQSVQDPRSYGTNELAGANARLSAMLQYILCVSQFARYVKVIGREKVGAFTTPQECEDYLHNWLVNYVTDDSTASIEARASRPLREARVSVKERPGAPGVYDCEIFLRPHYELDDLAAGVRLQTQLRNAVT